jgi:ribosomal protein S18 acetylase RimI-like enzyme
MTAFTVRPAIAADASAIAEIHYAGWQVAYSHVVSDEQMAAKLPERRIPFWQARIADTDCVVLIAEDEAGRAQGFVYAGDVLDHDIRKGNLAGFDAEIYSLHCRKDVQGRGLGRLLMAETARAFQKRGRKALVLWAYRDNAYRKFYEKIGGELIAEGFDDDIPDVAYGWRSLSVLAPSGGAEAAR